MNRFFQSLLLAMFILVGCNVPSNSASQKQYTGTVVQIIDGDTFVLLTSDKKSIKVRLFGIDSPERKQPYYNVCKKALGDICEGKTVTITVRSIDRYHRTVADAYLLPDKQWINYYMVANGFAWHFKRFSDNLTLVNAQDRASTARKGLWADPKPIAPWEWRDMKKDVEQF
jgi:endonuclease YncB( thermonuclease family)